MKPSAIFVNGARGRIVDEAALVEALRDGTIHAAGLDVFEREPLPPDSPLLAMHECRRTAPHRLGHARDAIRHEPARRGEPRCCARRQASERGQPRGHRHGPRHDLSRSRAAYPAFSSRASLMTVGSRPSAISAPPAPEGPEAPVRTGFRPSSSREAWHADG